MQIEELTHTFESIKKEISMKKTNQILMLLFTGLVCFAVFFLSGYLVSLFLGIVAVGMLLLTFGEKIISRIIIIVGGIGALYFAIVTFIYFFRVLL